MTSILVFLDDCYHWRWLRLDGDMVVARGLDLAAIVRETPDDPEVVAVVSGTSVVIHWVELPPLAPAQAATAAKLLAIDVCASAIVTTHVALGAIGADGKRPLALVERERVEAWLATLSAAGLVAKSVVPLPMLLPAPVASANDEDAPVSLMTIGEIGHTRGTSLAASGELPLLRLMLANRDVETVDQAMFESRLSTAIPPAINLRQGDFALRISRPLDVRQLRRIGMLAIAAATLWLGTEFAMVLRDNMAADRIEHLAADAARAVLPRGTAIDAPRAQVVARADRLGAGGDGFTELAGPLLEAMRDRSDLVLHSLRYMPDAGINAVITTPSASDRQALAKEIDIGGQVLTIGDPRDEAGVTVVDLAMRRR